jgi:hypothetical protein
MMSSCVEATVIGHSYVRRLHEKFADGSYVPRGPPELFYNFIGVGGARVYPPGAYKNIARWIPELKHRKPDIVFFHCGENDVGREGTSTFEISDQIIKIAEEIVKECHPKVLIICQLTYFPAHEPYGEISKRVTERLLQYEKVKRQRIMDTKLKVWTHTIGLNDENRVKYFEKDNVHLNTKGQWKYYKSVVAAVGRYARVVLEERKFE